MAAGQLDRRITLQSAATARDALGHAAETWSDWATLSAGVSYPGAGGAEGVDAGAEASRQVATFRIRYRSGVTRAMRIAYDGATWTIEAVAERGRRKYLDITARAERV